MGCKFESHRNGMKPNFLTFYQLKINGMMLHGDGTGQHPRASKLGSFQRKGLLYPSIGGASDVEAAISPGSAGLEFCSSSWF